MNYRHAYHAGNFADVFKHVLLVRALLALQRKPTPLRYLDTHAGPGWYDLAGEEARRGAEWQGGIGRLDSARAPADVQALLAPYLEAVGPREADGRPSLYPGSPGIARQLCRADDRLTLCELHPEDGAALKHALKGDRRAKMMAIDGYVALRATLPPPERRGLVFIDPPFEEKNEFAAMTEGLLAAHRKWPTGVYMLWYPVKNREALLRFAADLVASGVRRVAQVELIVEPGALSRGALAGCGMIVVNPPFGFEAEVGQVMPFLAQVLGREEPGSWRLRFSSQSKAVALNKTASASAAAPQGRAPDPDGGTAMSSSGTVKFFNGDKGYGFIKPDDGGRDIFVHVTAVEQAGLQSLNEGQKIGYEVEPDRKGKGPKAVNLQLL